jgi:hypothetical protein
MRHVGRQSHTAKLNGSEGHAAAGWWIGCGESNVERREVVRLARKRGFNTGGVGRGVEVLGRSPYR